MSFEIGGSKSKSKTSGKFETTPKAPAWVEDPTKKLTQAIMGLGNRPSSSFVTGSSPLQNAAFSMAGNVAGRYGMGQPSAQPMAQMGPAPQPPAPSGGGLFSSLGVTDAQTPDYDAYLQSNPDVAQWATTAMRAPHFAKGAGKTAADYDGDGVLSPTEMARHHFESSGQSEGRVMPGISQGKPEINQRPTNYDTPEGQMSTQVAKPEINGGMRSVDPDGAGAPQMNNPLDNYRDASLMTRIAGMSGPNLATGAQVGRVDPVTSAQVGQVNPVTGARVGRVAPSTSAQVGEVDPVTGARVGNVRDVSGASMGSESLLNNLSSYMNPYTNDVVNTTLTGFDTNADRLRARQAAAGAGRGAFGGSRYAIGEAVTEGELARERASSEAGLRSGAFNTGAALSGQDADRRQQAGAMNAQMAQQASLANQQSELSRMLAQAGYDQQAGLSNQQTNLSRALSQAGFNQQTGLANQDADLSRTLAQAGFNQQAGLANQQADLSRTLSQAGFDQQTGMANQQSDLSRILAQAGFDQQAGMFNAGQQDQSLDRTLRASGLLADIGATQQGQERADISQIAGLGDTQRGIQQDYDQADLQQLSAITQLLQQLGLGQFIGQSGTQSGKSSGTQIGVSAGYKIPGQ